MVVCNQNNIYLYGYMIIINEKHAKFNLTDYYTKLG